MRLPLAFLCVVAVLGCSSGPTGTATVTGPASVAFTAQDAIFASLPKDDGTREDVIRITSVSGTCDHTRDNVSVAGEQSLTLAIAQQDDSGARVAFTPGDFPISPPPGALRSATATLQTLDQACADTLSSPADQAGGGTVTLSALDSNFADGTFDLHFPGGAHLTGTFHAALCAEPTSPSKATCQ